MTEDQARRTANVIMAAGAIAGACYVLKEPRLRRLAWRLVRGWAAGPLVAWSAAEVRRAWDASAKRHPAVRSGAA